MFDKNTVSIQRCLYKSVEIHQQQTIHTRLASRQLITFISPTVPTRMCAYEKAYLNL